MLLKYTQTIPGSTTFLVSSRHRNKKQTKRLLHGITNLHVPPTSTENETLSPDIFMLINL